MRDALQFAHRDLACARIDHRFERCVRDECIDESAVERLGRPLQGVQLDRTCRLGFFDRLDGLRPDAHSHAELRPGHADRIAQRAHPALRRRL